MALTAEEQRALAYRAQQRRRRAAERAQVVALAGSPTAYQALLRRTVAIVPPYEVPDDGCTQERP
jgi:hypothetical protein